MPMYEYECECGEVRERITKDCTETVCAKCGKVMKRMVSGFAKTAGHWS